MENESMKTTELDVLKDPISKLFRGYAIPGIVASLSMCLYGIINGIILGRFVGPNALAAVNMASPIFNIISCIGILIAIGGNTLTAISLGEQNKRKANHYFNNAFYILFMITVAIFIMVVFFPHVLARIVGANSVLFPMVVNYIRTFGVFVVPVIFNILLGISLQSIGKPQLYMVGNLLSVVLNIILDLILICVFDMGITGAALASGISATAVFILFFSKFISKDSFLRVGRWKVELKAIGRMIYNGSSEAITQFSAGFSFMIFNWILITKFGETGVSSFAVVQYISLVVNAVIMGMSRGLGAISSVNYGAKEYGRITELIAVAIKIVTLVGVVCTAILIFFKSPFISLFVKDNLQVMTTSSEIITFYSFNFIFVGANIIINALYTAINNPKISAILAILRYVLLIGNFFILPLMFGNIGLWLSFVVAEIICVVVSYVCLKKTMQKWSLN
jgi:putative MATE family efflux protein